MGCKLNFSETSTIARDFESRGYSRVNFYDPADVYVINTCSVTDKADSKARKAVRQALRRSPEAFVAVIGCYAQLKPKKISEIPGVNLVLGAEEKFNLPAHIENTHLNGKPVILNSPINLVNEFVPTYSVGERTRAFLKIQDGCDYSCSFCTIPMARGKSRSGSIPQIIKQAEEISRKGIKEIVLTGVNLGDFAVECSENLFQLIQKLEKISGIERYRISSIEPNLLTNEIIEFVTDSEKFLPHFHIPLQSGSDKILKAMRRRYKRDLYADRVSFIKSKLPDACIGADVIVGFPGETNVDFLATHEFIRELEIGYLHVFSYSERDNTDAVNISPKVPKEEIGRRSKTLHILSEKMKRKFKENNLGNMRTVLFETMNDNQISGLTENYIRVNVPGSAEFINNIFKVNLLQIKDNVLFGEMVH